MKTCLISPFFYPEPISTGKYNTVLAKNLKENGTDLTVFCSHPIYPDWKVTRSADQLDGIEIIRGGSGIFYPKSATLRRAILEIWFAAFIFKNVILKSKEYDNYVLIFPPSLFALFFASLAKKRKNIYGIVHDLQGVYAQKSKSIPGRILQWAIRLVEQNSFNHCSHLIFLSDSMLERAATEYQLDRRKCSVNYPFVALPQIEVSKSNSNSLPEEVISSQKFNFVYSGALGQKQNPHGLVNLMINLSENIPEIDFHIFSAGPSFEEIKNIGKSSKVKFHDLVQAEQLTELYRRSNIQIIPQADGTADGSLPSKLPNLLASNTAIFAICEKNTELDLLLNAVERAGVCNTWDTKNLTAAVNTFIKEIRNPVAEELGPGRTLILEKFKIDTLIQKLLGIGSTYGL